MIRLVGAIFFATTVTAACGTKDSVSDAPAPPPPYEGPSFSLVGANNTNWVSDCQPVKDRENRSRRATVTFTEPKFVVTTIYFDGLDCQDNLRRATYRDKFYNVRKDEMERLAGWTTIAYQVEQITLALHKEALVLAYNDNNNFGYSTWTSRIEMDVTGRQFDQESEKELDRDATRERTFQISGEQLFFAKYESDVPVASTEFGYRLVK